MYVYGAGGHSKVVRDILKSNDTYIDGIFDDSQLKEISEGFKPERKIDPADYPPFSSLKQPLIICIGNNVTRALTDKRLEGGVYGQAIHPTAIIASDVKIGEGTVVMHGAIIQTGSTIGRHVIINTSATIDYDNTVGDYAHISPKAVLCDHVSIGEGTHVGSAAIVLPQIKVGKWCVVGAGAVVIRDLPDFTIAVGNPARILVEKSLVHKMQHVFNPKAAHNS
jgi:acetyltransferase EpsM